ncbi:permease [Pseudomonas sp. NPDC089734]|uniref:permease n=1 Tax=Pseudomonas sp. NPDC089734 TaxID=3364469 RepID=UPI003801478F
MLPTTTDNTVNASLPCSEIIISWTIKTIACSPKELLKAHITVIVANLLPFLFCTWALWDNLPESIGFIIAAGCAAIAFSAYLIILIVRQKTIFKYHICPQKGYVEYFIHYPDFAAPFFKGVAIFTILLFVGVALVTGSLLFLIGPAAMAVGAARSLLNWENPIHHEQSRPWGEHNFVTVDRKRSMIVIHCTDITVGFEARFPDKQLFEQYLQFLHTVLPPTAEFTERAWEW